MTAQQTVFLVDDQAAVLKALSRLLTSAGFAVETFESAQQFLASERGAAPGCLVLDLSMPEMGGLGLQEALARRASLMPIIFLTGHGDIDSGVRAMKLGASDFLTKPVDDERLLAAVRLAFARNLAARATDAEQALLRERLASLTPREREVLALVVEGQLNKQIAFTLGAAEKTIKVHRARVMAKMQVRTLAALVRLMDRERAADPHRPMVP